MGVRRGPGTWAWLALLVACLLLAARPATAADEAPDPFAALRSSDTAKRTEALEQLSALPVETLRERKRGLLPRLRRIADKDALARNRGLALQAYALTAGADGLDLLVERLRDERDPLVERMLRPAFAVLPSEPARKALSVAAFDVSDPRRASLAAETLGWLPGSAGLDDVLALLDTAHHWAVLAGTCLGARHLRDVRVVGKLVPRLRHPDPCVRAAALETLEHLTGEDFGTTPHLWEEWWESVRKTYRLPASSESDDIPAPAVPRPARDGATSAGIVRGRPTFSRFFGVELTGRRVAFVVDYSQSMWGDRRTKAERELIAAVKGLPSDHTFAVVLFNGKVWWHRPGPVPARPQEKLDLVGYLAEQETKNYTNIYDALEQAIGLLGEGPAARDPAPGLDEAVLLSDGEPNRGKLKKPEQIVAAVEAWLAGRIPLHTVSLLDEKSALLEDLARVTKGRHVHDPVLK